jgi:hypothetical protein
VPLNSRTDFSPFSIEKSKPKLLDKEQSERFKEIAREIGVYESGERFEEAFTKLAKPKKGLYT